MERMLLALSVLSLGMLFVLACNEPSPIGAELVEGDQANIKHTDSVTIIASTVTEDSVLVFDPDDPDDDPRIVFLNFFIGDYEDPIFGNVVANLNAQFWPSFTPDFDDAVFDSLVLILRYDSTNTYGNLTTFPYRIGVYELTENLDLNRRYYSNETFPYDMVPLGETGDFIPKYTSADTLRIVDYTLDEADTITQGAHLRIHLSEDFANRLMMDSALYSSTSAFLEQFNGLVVKGLNPTQGILSFNLRSAISNLTLYYHQDTVYKQYEYDFNSSGVIFSNFDHDYAGSTVGDFLNDKSKGDSLLFIQSMSGTNIKIEFPYADQFGDIIVNKAELEFTFAVIGGDDITFYPPLDMSIMTIEDSEDGGLAVISDVVFGDILGQNWFGGQVRESLDNQGNTLYTYSYNISSHFQSIVDGVIDDAILIRASRKQERTKRSILYGPKHSKYPVKFNFTYTELNP